MSTTVVVVVVEDPDYDPWEWPDDPEEMTPDSSAGAEGFLGYPDLPEDLTW